MPRGGGPSDVEPPGPPLHYHSRRTLTCITRAALPEFLVRRIPSRPTPPGLFGLSAPGVCPALVPLDSGPWNGFEQQVAIELRLDLRGWPLDLTQLAVVDVVDDFVRAILKSA